MCSSASTWPLESMIRDDLCFNGYGPRVRAAPQNTHVELPTWETMPKLISEHLSLDWALKMNIKGMDDVRQNDSATRYYTPQPAR
jgi:hypothetical protein